MRTPEEQTPRIDESATVKLDDSTVTVSQDNSQNTAPNTPKRRRRIKLVAVLVAIVAVALIGVGVLTVLSDSDTVTITYGSETPVTVTRSSRIIPLSSEREPLESYVVHITSATDSQGNDIDLSDEPEEFKVSGVGGFTMQDLLPDVVDGTYVLEVDDGEQTHTTPPIVVDEDRGITGDVLIEPSEGTQGEIQDDEAAGNGASNTEEELYREILDQFYDNITSGWVDYEATYEYGDTEDISYLFPLYYADPSNIDLIGYQFIDLDNDGTSELLIGMDGEEYYQAVIIDLYTVKDGQIVHLASSGERYRYQLCEDGTIYLYGSSSAASSAYEHYELIDGELSMIECVWFEPEAGNFDDIRWHYSTSSVYDSEREIDEAEGAEIIDGWPQVIDLALTPFSEYVSTETAENSTTEDPLDLTRYLGSIDEFYAVVGGSPYSDTGHHENWFLGTGIQYGNYIGSTSVDALTIEYGSYELFGISVGIGMEDAEEALGEQGWAVSESGNDYVLYENGDMNLQLRTEGGVVSSVSFSRNRRE